MAVSRRRPATRDARRVRIDGRPAAALRNELDRGWRRRVADAGRRLAPARGLRLDFTLAARRWVDLDSLVEVAVAGLRDAGVVESRPPTLDALVATKDEGTPSGLRVQTVPPAHLLALRRPGPVALSVQSDELRLHGNQAAKRRLRARLAAAWPDRRPLVGRVWAEVAMTTANSLLGPLEPALDALEPVLGRDPRGQPRQEFFPNDHLIVWLRLRRTPPPEPPLRLTIGTVTR